jgi:hypothetical protein
MTMAKVEFLSFLILIVSVIARKQIAANSGCKLKDGVGAGDVGDASSVAEEEGSKADRTAAGHENRNVAVAEGSRSALGDGLMELENLYLSSYKPIDIKVVPFLFSAFLVICYGDINLGVMSCQVMPRSYHKQAWHVPILAVFSFY